MTELEIMQRAKMYMDKLAQGIDPISGREVPEDSALNNVRLARCFFYVSGILEQVIANGGEVRKPSKDSFYMTEEELQRVRPALEPVRITQFVDLLMAAINDPNRKRLNAATVTNWLLEKGFLTKQQGADGKSVRLPSETGMQIGLFARIYQGQNGEYQSVFYSTEAQRFLLEHLPEILR